MEYWGREAWGVLGGRGERQGTGERSQHGTGAPYLLFAQGLLPSHKAVQDSCNRKGTDCCRLATGLAPRKPKALDAEHGWERSSRRKILWAGGVSRFGGPQEGGVGKADWGETFGLS